MATRKSGRKSKRRSVNPLIVVVAICGVLLVALVVGLVVGKSMIQSWLRGEEFRAWLTQKSSETLRSQVELAPMKWQGSDVYAESFIARGYEEGAFSSMKLEGVRAKLGKIEDQAVQIPNVSVNRFELEFSDSRVKQPIEQRLAESEGTSDSSGPTVPGWLQKYVPNRAEIDEVSISSSLILAKNSDGTIPFRLSGAEAKVFPDFKSGFWAIEGRRGKMEIPDQPEIELKDLAMRWKGSELFIDQCSLGIYSEGHVEGAGDISFASDGQFDLDLQISGISVDDMVEGEWEEKLSGVISGPVKITGKPGAFVYEGDIMVADAVIEKIPVLTVISKYTRNEQFKYLVLSEARTHFRSQGEQVEMSDLVLQSDGLVRVEGDMVVAGERIAGAFQVGVAPGTLRWIPGAERKVFIKERDGFLWTTMNLTGTLDEPVEDLSGKLIAAAGAAILEELPEGLLDEAQKFLNPETEGEKPNSLLEQGKPLLDLLTPFLR